MLNKLKKYTHTYTQTHTYTHTLTHIYTHTHTCIHNRISLCRYSDMFWNNSDYRLCILCVHLIVLMKGSKSVTMFRIRRALAKWSHREQ